MPRGDKTGPNGNGPKTGRGLGYCAGNNNPGYYFTNNEHKTGRGFGYRHRFANNYLTNNDDVSEKTIIKNQINILKDKLSALEERLNNL